MSFKINQAMSVRFSSYTKLWNRCSVTHPDLSRYRTLAASAMPQWLLLNMKEEFFLFIIIYI